MIISFDYSLIRALYTADFSTIRSSTSKAAVSMLEAALICIHELGIITFEAGAERSEWVQSVIAECHYRDLPTLQTEYDECGLVVLMTAAITTAAAEAEAEAEADFIDCEYFVAADRPHSCRQKDRDISKVSQELIVRMKGLKSTPSF